MFGLPSLSTIAIAGVAVIGAFAAGAVWQHNREAVADLKAEIEALHFDARESAAKAKEADADRGMIEASDADNEEKIDAAEAILARGYGCPSASELAWLRSIGTAGPGGGPPVPAGDLRDAGASAAAQGCDPWPIIAARERAGRLTNESKIIGFARWYRGLRADYAKGRKK